MQKIMGSSEVIVLAIIIILAIWLAGGVQVSLPIDQGSTNPDTPTPTLTLTPTPTPIPKHP